MNERNIAIGFAATLVLAGLSAANAAPTGEAGPEAQGQVTRSVAVRYASGARQEEEGARALYEQLEAAARRACGQADVRPLQSRARWKQCYEAALADAIEQVGYPRLVAVTHRSRSTASTE